MRFNRYILNPWGRCAMKNKTFDHLDDFSQKINHMQSAFIRRHFTVFACVYRYKSMRFNFGSAQNLNTDHWDNPVPILTLSDCKCSLFWQRRLASIPTNFRVESVINWRHRQRILSTSLLFLLYLCMLYVKQFPVKVPRHFYVLEIIVFIRCRNSEYEQ